MRKKINVFVILFILCVGFTSCDSTDLIYEDNQGFENNTWAYDDVKEFKFTIPDSITPAKIFLNLRTTLDYQYSNIYMYLHIAYPNGFTDVDTLEFFLAQPNGKWLGEVSGTVVENQALIAQGIFNDPGEYTYKIEQAMYNDALDEIIDVGIRVEYMNIEQ